MMDEKEKREWGVKRDWMGSMERGDIDAVLRKNVR
jgi:hypothetical protein